MRVGCGFRRPTAAQSALLDPMWARALAYCQLRPDEVDLYVQRSAQVNAFASGGRSVAVTTGVVADFAARRLGEAHIIAIMTHDRSSPDGSDSIRPAQQLARRTVAGAVPAGHRGSAGPSGRQPRRLLGVVLVAGVPVAIVQAVQQRH
ncbi:M48 family metalloprotease [Jatrophihabitans lederbergiae]|uniref:Uncharacterized protein n=1 Tax=Jatrophihabitans lederbergiae TaxID=3075547 RepID=A0ABU2JBC2_9ACTN|nr:hypothetical protein [Jatrophihabitans sp. DSM 44399]MDT0262290.1 hypothetical protein [Jatrophihabitans sp. DSM 44399]